MTAAAPMTLKRLLAGIADTDLEVAVSALCADSRALKSGDVFVGLRGHAIDGRSFLRAAADAGAVAALVEDEFIEQVPGLPSVVVPELRSHLGELASRLFGNPSSHMHVMAVTGTNGKTTVSHLYAQLLRAAGERCGVIGTLGASLDGAAAEAANTTPDPISLQSILADWSEQGVRHMGMEASSHALVQGRLAGMDVDVAVFTNLTRDHLDYHGSMEAYGDAKAELFLLPSVRVAVINGDDPFSDALLQRLPASVRLVTIHTGGRTGTSAGATEVSIENLQQSLDGLAFDLVGPWGRAHIASTLLGAFNAHNLACAIVAAHQAGVAMDALIAAVPTLTAVPGRMEPLRAEGAPLVVIDYAHTPDALRQVAAAVRAQCDGTLCVVFGCGGDRDRGKRPLMAQAVSEFADRAVITSDNPRSEDPLAIIKDIEEGMSAPYAVCEDRGAAIAQAIKETEAGDCVLVAGKGHEDYQIVGDQRLHFSDRECAIQVLEALAA